MSRKKLGMLIEMGIQKHDKHQAECKKTLPECIVDVYEDYFHSQVEFSKSEWVCLGIFVFLVSGAAFCAFHYAKTWF